MPVVVPQSSSCHGPTLTRKTMLFVFLLCSVIGYLRRRRKKYSESVCGRASAELDASQSCLQQLPPDDQFLRSTLMGWSDSYRFRGQAVLQIEKVVALWRRALAPSFQYGQGSVRLSRLPKINTFLQDSNST
jgi:hypothetical protein